ncbi:hypothetical protein QGN29_05450 [Temperatibacter marinus]|uniref:Uncharacterized protein n=1 Tax=Temperatibacter marinus TaxID=1456591 RepID=A0AA52HAC5_9PROT|nr:hypothetical protein [Temperatibacter marinus]WND03819.1 hypothetical protein QGN29_05450 [Temperatibacter marinus]
MQLESLPFDPNIYFGHVADNLLKNFGNKAIGMAEDALKKMRLLGDNEGFDMWLGVQRHLTMKAELEDLEDQITLH